MEERAPLTCRPGTKALVQPAGAIRKTKNFERHRRPDPRGPSGDAGQALCGLVSTSTTNTSLQRSQPSRFPQGSISANVLV